MFCRFIFTFLFFFFPIVSVSGDTLLPKQDTLITESAQFLRDKNYAAAIEHAREITNVPARNFIIGVASYHLENWKDSAEFLTNSSDDFALLGDYALYYRASALYQLNRNDEAKLLLRKLRKEFPGSPFIRVSDSLYADILFNGKDYTGALLAYRNYVEKYPSGQHALKALLQAALCREALGEKEKAGNQFRSIWLNYPDSPVAALAEKNLLRLKAEGVQISSFTAEEMYKRGVILYDLQKHKQALEAFNSIDHTSLPANLASRITLKTGQALFKSRQYKEAEQTFSKLETVGDREIAREASYWLAKTLDRRGKEQQAATIYQKIAENSPKSELADEALFNAALIKKSTGESGAAINLLERLVKNYPSSILVGKALWEDAWIRYGTRDYRGASVCLECLLDKPEFREKAMYWLGKARSVAGQEEEARALFNKLVTEYPYGFYALQYRKNGGLADVPVPAVGNRTPSLLPLPHGYERAKTLITLGLLEEAGMELSALRKKASGKSRTLDLARLYWEMQDYRSAMGLFRKIDGKNPYICIFLYPRAYSENVSRYAEHYKVPENLAYSIMRAESSFSRSVRSPVGAVGLMQVMPATARFITRDKTENINAAQLTHPELNVNLGLKHLKNLLLRYDNNFMLAIAAYNSGATPVDRWRKKFPVTREDEFIENISYPETREYVKKVLTSLTLYNSLYRSEIPGATAFVNKPSPAVPGIAASAADREVPQAN